MKYETKIKKLPKSEAELEISLPADFLNSARKKAIDNFSLSLELPGFRKGHIPENIVIEKIGENAILEEAADILIREHFPKIIEQENLDIIGRPKISITKLASGNPIEFKAVFAVMPEFKLPDYKKIAGEINKKTKSKEEKTEATEKEVEDVLLQIRKNKAHFDWHEAHKNETGHDHPEIKDEDLPPLDDKLAKAAGNFKNLDELKDKVKQNIEIEKKSRNIEKTRAEIMEGLVKNTEIDLPEILVENETEKSLAQMKSDIERMGSKLEDYLQHVKKTEEDLKKDFKKSSENKAKIQLLFNKIIETEKIEPDKEILENEIKEVMKHYPEASEASVRVYVATIILNSEVLKLLENQ
jgi:trigger factor